MPNEWLIFQSKFANLHIRRKLTVNKQEAFVLYFADEGNTNLSALNSKLSEGYQVVTISPMSGTGESGSETPQSPFPYSRAVVILSKSS